MPEHSFTLTAHCGKLIPRRRAIKILYDIGIRSVVFFGATKIQCVSASVEKSHETNNKESETTEVTCQTQASPWLGMNPAFGGFTESTWVNAVVQHSCRLHVGVLRVGIDGVGGTSTGAAFNWATRDAIIDRYVDAGLALHGVIDPKYHVSRCGDWMANWANFCDNVMRRYYNRTNKVLYYVIGNELDMANPAISVSTMMQLQKIAYDKSREIAPDGSIKIESCPGAHFEAQWQRDLILDGVTRYCDFVGVHIYGGGILDGRYGRPSQIIHQANSQSDYPIRAVANSENGYSSSWAPGGVDRRDWQGKFFSLNYIQSKRYGYDHVILYSLSRSLSGDSFNLAGWDGTNISPYIAYGDVRDHYVPHGLQNAGFESANDPYRGSWIVHWNIDNSDAPEIGRVAFVTNDARNARSGDGYCKVTSGGPNKVRQVVSNLTAGQQYTVAVWAKGSGDTAYLKALGYNVMDGNEEKSASLAVRDTYQELQVQFTPTKDWVVVSLESNGNGRVYWDDVSLIS